LRTMVCGVKGIWVRTSVRAGQNKGEALFVERVSRAQPAQGKCRVSGYR
jgi:hypothetical protein